MAHQFTVFHERFQEIVDWLSKEFSSIRAGRANPGLLDGVKVESYGTQVPINQVGSVGIEDARTIRITVWDTDQISQVERAIVDADLGVSVSTDGSGLRVIFPELTSERREQLQKLAKSKCEEARVSLRSLRDEVIKDIEVNEKAGELSEDEKFKAKEALQKLVDDANDTFTKQLARKESEISE